MPLALSASAGCPGLHVQAPKEPHSRRHAQPAAPGIIQVADATRPKQARIAAKDVILNNILSDQISEMRRKSALPTTMCTPRATVTARPRPSPALMARLAADNAQVEDTPFTIKHATECESAGQRMVDSETSERAMLIVVGPMESDMKGLMTGCGDYVGGFVPPRTTVTWTSTRSSAGTCPQAGRELAQ